MPIDLIGRAKNAWNAFINNKDPTKNSLYDAEYGYSYRPDRSRVSRGTERSIVNAVYNRIAIDVAGVDIRHVRLDENDRYLETIKSDLNECLSVEANVDQTGRSFIQDIVISMFDEGCIAVIPVDTDIDPNTKAIHDIYSMRTAKIISWRPKSVRVRAYNENTGQYQEIDVLKCNTLIIQNPLYEVINEPNSTMQRLIRKLALLDSVDEQSSAGKLDLIIQLPYTVRSELRKQQANERKQMIEEQLAGSKYGIAYIDSTEHITQLNRAVENNLMSQIEYLTNMVYSQLGITAEILNGTADEKTMLNYNNRTIKPILLAITEEMKRKWLTKTARTQGQSIMFFRDPFSLVPVSNIAEIADKFTRNEIMTSNEIRQAIGMKKSDDPNADQLRNKNLNQSAEAMAMEGEVVPEEQAAAEEMVNEAEIQNDYDSAIKDLDNLDTQLDDLDKRLGHSAISFNEIFEEYLRHGIEDSESYDDWFAHYASPYYDPVKAHEYYMKHRKLVGRHSTSGLNEEGREIAAMIKQNINTERKQKTDANTAATNSQISSSQARTNSSIQQTNEKRQEDIAKSKESMQKRIDHFKSLTNSIKDAHKSAMDSRIKSLQSEISAKGKTSEQKEAIRKRIAELRESNAKKRAELQQNYNNLSSKARSEHSTTSANIRESASNENAAVREEHRTTSSKLRAENRDTNAKIKEEYDEKLSEELEKLKASGQYEKEKKSKSKSGSDKKLYKFKNHQ